MENCIVCTSPCEHEPALCGDCWKNECPFPEIQCAECQEREEEREREDRETLRLIHDSGHAWLEVPLQAVIASGIVPSKYSYVDADAGFAYLEEDCDLSKWLDVIGDEPPMTNVYIAGDAWVRDLPRWTTHADTPVEPLRYTEGTPQWRVLERAVRQYGDRLRIESKRETVTTLQGNRETGWIVYGRAHGGDDAGVVFPGSRQDAQNVIDAVTAAVRPESR